ncbi:MAG: AAA family ATPase [Deltaproteobacteria bacterium]|nr:AAA family ATPase [Deltaproteobacteria bacterium]
MALNSIPVRLELKTDGAKNALEKIVRSQKDFLLRTSGEQRNADLFVLEIGDHPETDFELVHHLLTTNSVGEVFITSPSSDPSLLVQALRSGAREFFSQPIQETEVIQALERFKARREQYKEERRPYKRGKIIDLIGSKGGVGNTTIAVNLATSLAAEGGKTRVALIDMNLLFGEVPIFLDIVPTYSWGEIARNITRLDSTFLMSVLHEHSSHVFVLPSPTQLSGDFDATPEVIERLLDLMKRVFDYIVVDSGLITDEISMKILEIADAVLLTAILSLPCLTNVSRLLKLFYDLGYPHEDLVKIVINRYIKSSEISLKDAEKSIGKKIFWSIPNDFHLTMSAINQGKPLMEVGVNSPVARSIKELADTLVEYKIVPERKGSFMARLFGQKLAAKAWR